MSVRGTRLLNLNQRVHHLKTGRPTGVTVRAAALGDGYIDVMSTSRHSETLTNDYDTDPSSPTKIMLLNDAACRLNCCMYACKQANKQTSKQQ